eukprot:gene12222-biopygen7271
MFSQRCSKPDRGNDKRKVQQGDLCGAMWGCVALYNAVWRRVMPCGAVRRRVAQSVPCAQSHVAPCCTEAQSVPCGMPCAFFLSLPPLA